jgi:spore coat polysaccharide biosynthesis protein SpsF (cytidylyltransferase family)
MSRLNLANVPDLSDHRWTVDDDRDLAFVRAVHARLEGLPPPSRYAMRAVLDVLDAEPALRDINRGSERDEGYRRSVASERGPSQG